MLKMRCGELFRGSESIKPRKFEVWCTRRVALHNVLFVGKAVYRKEIDDQANIVLHEQQISNENHDAASQVQQAILLFVIG